MIGLTYFLLLIIFSQAHGQTNLSKLIEEQHGSRILLSLNSGKYYLDGMVVIQNVEEFILRGNETIVECAENKQTNRDYKYFLEFLNVSRILFEGITFQECNKYIELKDPPSETEGYFFFKYCDSVRVKHCNFINIRGINLLCYNTFELNVSDSIFQNIYTISKAMLLFVNDTRNQLTSLEVRRSKFVGEEWMSGYNDQKDHANFAVKCGGAISVLITCKMTVSIQILDNEFIRNKAAHGGAIGVWLGEDVHESSINIERGNFVGGKAQTRSEDEKFHERPGGGAIVLFLFTADSKLLISNCNFTNNHGYRGGALYLDYSLPTNESKIENCTFEGNKGQLGGAVMLTTTLIPDKVYIKFVNTAFIGNEANELGGAILAMQASISMWEENIVTNNVVKYGDGGGLGLVYSHILVNGSFQVVNNTAHRAGGGVYMTSQGKISMGTSGSVLNISRNIAKMYGGGLYAYSLNYEYTFIEKIAPMKEKLRRICFLRGHPHSTIVMLGNIVENDNKACSGNTAYTQLLGKCLTQDIVEGNLEIDQGECSRDSRENSFNLEMDSIISITCNKSLFTTTNDIDSTSVNILHYCNADGNIDPFIKKEDQIPLKMIQQFYKANNNISRFYYIYPGYTTTINISSNDYFNNSVVTRANLSAIIYSDGKKRHDLKPNPLEFSVFSQAYNTSYSFLTNKSLSVLLKSRWYGLGVVCVKSVGGYTQIEKCIGIIMGKCPPGFQQKKNECQCIKSSWYQCTQNNQVIVKPGIYMANKYSLNDSRIKMHQAKCLSFRCKCHLGVPQSTCTFNPMKPDEQCYNDLKGPLCGECSNPNKTLLYSPFLSVNFYNNCFDCTQPELRIAGVVGILFLICAIIMILKTNFFQDYLRSIIFYANILYIILANSNSYIIPIVLKALAVPVLLLNLLVTQFMPFCIYSQNNPILVTIFQMIAPTAMLFLFLGLQRLLIRFRYSNFFSKREVPTQILSMLLLTYTDLSIHSFMVLNCPEIVNTRYWLYQGSTVCFTGTHLKATLLSVFIISILIAIPCFLSFIAYDKRRMQDYRFIECMTNYFNIGLPRYWEIFKLFLRLLISFLLSWVTNYVNSDEIKIVVSIICFVTMIINSVCQPAKDEYSNHFESLCFLFLGIIAIPQKSNGLFMSYFAPIPFVVGSFALLLVKLKLWKAKFKKIKEKFGEELTIWEKLKKLWSIMDANDINSVEAI